MFVKRIILKFRDVKLLFIMFMNFEGLEFERSVVVIVCFGFMFTILVVRFEGY